jgi:hypothetical protein
MNWMKNLINNFRSTCENPTRLLMLIFVGALLIDFLTLGRFHYWSYGSTILNREWQFIIIILLLLLR